MTAPDDGLKRMRAAQRFRTISFIVVAALAASALLPPQYSFAGFAIPVAVTAIVLSYFHRTAQNTEQGIVILGALAILFAWGSTFVNAHDRGQHRRSNDSSARTSAGRTRNIAVRKFAMSWQRP